MDSADAASSVSGSLSSSDLKTTTKMACNQQIPLECKLRVRTTSKAKRSVANVAVAKRRREETVGQRERTYAS